MKKILLRLHRELMIVFWIHFSSGFLGDEYIFWHCLALRAKRVESARFNNGNIIVNSAH